MNTAPSPAAPAGRLPLFHRHHARRQRGKALAHVAPALLLAASAMAVLTGEEPLTKIVVLEFVVGAAYLLLMVRELRHLRHHPHHQESVAWLELAAAGILALEGYHLWHRHHEAEAGLAHGRVHVLPYLYWTLALVFMGMAFGVGHLLARRHLHLHDAGFTGRLHPFGRAFHLKWADLAAAEPTGPADLLLTRTNGQQQRLSFATLHDGPAHRDRLLAHIRERVGE